MGARPEVRIPIENDRQMALSQPALSQSFDSFQENEDLILHGIANVSCSGYYLITNLGLHYPQKQKAGFMKKSYEGRFFPRSRMTSASIDQIAGPQYAYLRINDENNKQALVMWFDEEPWQDRPCLLQAQEAAEALGFS